MVESFILLFYQRFDEALLRAEELLDLAKQHAFRGHEALALRDKGRIEEKLGRDKQSLPCYQLYIMLSWQV